MFHTAFKAPSVTPFASKVKDTSLSQLRPRLHQRVIKRFRVIAFEHVLLPMFLAALKEILHVFLEANGILGVRNFASVESLVQRVSISAREVLIN